MVWVQPDTVVEITAYFVGGDTNAGDIITLEGIITLEKDFGSGYFFDVIMENSRIVEPAQ